MSAWPLVGAPGPISSALTPGDEGAAYDLARWAVIVVSGRVRAYVGATLWPPTEGTLQLVGTRASALVVGERPLTAVTAVRLDGTVLAATEYRWQRRGVLWRDLGWADASHAVEVDGSWGYDDVPADLAGVVSSAAARLTANPWGLRAFQVQDPGPEDYNAATFALVDEWTVAERVVLDRYRRRSFP